MLRLLEFLLVLLLAAALISGKCFSSSSTGERIHGVDQIRLPGRTLLQQGAPSSSLQAPVSSTVSSPSPTSPDALSTPPPSPPVVAIPPSLGSGTSPPPSSSSSDSSVPPPLPTVSVPPPVDAAPPSVNQSTSKAPAVSSLPPLVPGSPSSVGPPPLTIASPPLSLLPPPQSPKPVPSPSLPGIPPLPSLNQPAAPPPPEGTSPSPPVLAPNVSTPSPPRASTSPPNSSPAGARPPTSSPAGASPPLASSSSPPPAPAANPPAPPFIPPSLSPPPSPPSSASSSSPPPLAPPPSPASSSSPPPSAPPPSSASSSLPPPLAPPPSPPPSAPPPSSASSSSPPPAAPPPSSAPPTSSSSVIPPAASSSSPPLSSVATPTATPPVPTPPIPAALPPASASPVPAAAPSQSSVPNVSQPPAASPSPSSAQLPLPASASVPPSSPPSAHLNPPTSSPKASPTVTPGSPPPSPQRTPPPAAPASPSPLPPKNSSGTPPASENARPPHMNPPAATTPSSSPVTLPRKPPLASPPSSVAPGPTATLFPVQGQPPDARHRPAASPAVISTRAHSPHQNTSAQAPVSLELPGEGEGSKHPSPGPQPSTVTFPQPKNSNCGKTCNDPYVTTLPGVPCGCVIPMRVGVSLGSPMYALLPLVSELSGELAAGTSLTQRQVVITGASSIAEGTFVRASFVPLRWRFGNKPALGIAQKLWAHQVVINEALFGNYTVQYIDYPGLPAFYSQGMAGTQQPTSGFIPEQPLGFFFPQSRGHKKMGAGTIVAITLTLAFVILVSLGLGWLLIKRRHGYGSHTPLILESLETNKRTTAKSSPSSTSLSSFNGSVKTFSLQEMQKATEYFNSANIIGQGGFGRVYCGVLEDKTKVAVKVLIREDQQGDREFAAELEMLSRLHHRNLVKLVGICLDQMRCLVYELISSGSLEYHLHGGGRPLDWDVRMKIALGAAKGLAYLHEDCFPRVIHRDFKASNILLEDDFTPKVSDFGLAKAASEELTGHVSTKVMGTFGYVAPEYAMTGHLLVKSDVYSYGVVLLELISGRRPVDMSRSPGQENLVTWARPLLTNPDGLELLLDHTLEGSVSFEDLARVAAIAAMCVQPEVADRPFMGEVVQALKLVCNDTDGSEAATPQADTALHVWDALTKQLEEEVNRPATGSDYEDTTVLVRSASESSKVKPEQEHVVVGGLGKVVGRWF